MYNLYIKGADKALDDVTVFSEKFAKRLVYLRMRKGVSAREMSISLGLANNYINGIENGKSMPSMVMFWAICKYLDITPQEFFDFDNKMPSISRELLEEANRMDNETMQILLQLMRKLNTGK